MRKIYYLSTCSTCTKILSQLNSQDAELINLRLQNISSEDLDILYQNVGSYEALFNKRAQKWKLISESERPKVDKDYRNLILSEYTFLKRPAVIINGQVAIGNDSKSVERMIELLKVV